jgi:hypothetical protein
MLKRKERGMINLFKNCKWYKKRLYKKIVLRYKNNPAKFIEDCFGIELYECQKEAINTSYNR